MSLTCSSTCSWLAFGFYKTARAFERASSTLARRAFIESRIRFANKASRVPCIDLVAAVSAAEVSLSCSFSPSAQGVS